MMMQAIAKVGPGPDDLCLMQVPVPAIGDHQLRVRIRAIGVGVHDGYFLPPNIRYPYPIGIEGAGTIEKVGSKVSGYREGEAIAFVSAMQPKGGTWAEYAVVEESALIMRIPEGMMFAEAAAVPVAGNTLLKALHALRLEPGHSLFIAGASGAIGSLAIQLAAAKGCVVAGSASQQNHAYMRELGATLTVDYREASWPARIMAWMPGGMDAALAIQPGTGAESMPLVKDGGRMVVVSGDQVVPERGIRVEQIPHHIDVTRELDQLMNQIARKEIKLEIGKTFAFENSLDALRETQTRRARGKRVIVVP